MSFEKAKSYTAEFDRPPRRTPCSQVPDGPLCGNGDIGVAAAAAPEQGTVDFYLGKNDIWNSLSVGETPGMRCYGFLRFSCPGDFKNFRARQRIDNAELEITLSGPDAEWKITCVVLRGTNLILNGITAVRGHLPIEAELFHTHRDETVSEIRKNTAIYGRKTYEAQGCDWPCEAVSITALLKENGVCLNPEKGNSACLNLEKGNSLCLNSEKGNGACLNSEKKNGECLNPEKESSLYLNQKKGNSLYLDLEEGQSVTVATILHTNQEGDCRKLCEEEMAGLSAEKLSDLRGSHETWWRDFWEESSISVPEEALVERYWYVSHYLMACCCGSGKFAPGLFGSWVTTDTPAWCGDYHLNYNYEAPWWGLYSSNHISLTEPYDRPLLEYMQKSELAARRKLGCGGLYTLVGIGPRGLRTAALETEEGKDDINYWGQKSNASYAALNMLMRFYNTYDKDYTLETAYPYLERTADFWLDYLEWDGERYVIRNDCIHESPCPDGKGDTNPILSLGLIRTLFQGLIDICDTFGLKNWKRERWSHVLKYISRFPVMERNGRTVFRLSEEGMDWNDGNSLAIQHVFPAGCIGLGSPEPILQIARNTYEEMERWDDYNAFATYFPAGVRLGVSSGEILRHLNEQLRGHGMTNGFIFYGGGGIECCSTVPVTLNEMLVQSHEGVIRLFPVWDLKKEAAFRNLRAYGAFLVSAEVLGGVIGKVEIVSEKGRECTVEFPEKVTAAVQDGSGKEIGRFEGTRFTFPTKEGERYQISLL